MSDLISREKLLEEMCNSCSTEACDGMGRNSTAKCFSIRLVEEAPTVYDADKVVEQVKRLYGCDSCDLPGRYECSPGHCIVAEVIEVIRNGGAE